MKSVEEMHMEFQKELSGATQTAETESLPPETDDGQGQEQTATAEGDTETIETKTDQDTTAEPEGAEPKGEEEQGVESRWSEDDLKMLEAKGWGDLEFNDKTASIVKSLRDTEAQYQRVSQSNSNALNRNAIVENALRTKDFDSLKKLGFDVDIDRRTPDDQRKEIEANWEVITKTLNPALEKLNLDDEQYNVLQGALSGLSNHYNMQVQKINNAKSESELEQRILAKAGINTQSTNGYESLAKQAEANLVDIAKDDSSAFDNYQVVADATKEGGPLWGLNIDLAKAYSNPESAKFFNEVGSAMLVKKNFSEHVDKEIKRRGEQERKASGAKPLGNTGSKGAPTLSPLEQQFKSHMGIT